MKLTMTNIKVKPPVDIHYVGVDVTDAIDTVAFGHMWNSTFKWRNLLSVLGGHPTATQHRIDFDHPKLPIARVSFAHQGKQLADTCVMPQGIDARGTSPLWSGRTRRENLADINDACRFMQSFIMSPGTDGRGINDQGRGDVAELVYVSSHGFSYGDAKGEVHEAEPIFSLSRATADPQKPRQFFGPKWLILANCSMLSSSTHEDWLKVMSGPNPLRGVVGYNNSSPGPAASVNIAAAFIKRLAAGMPFKDAWAQTISNFGLPQNWVVLCHEQAAGDTVAKWEAGRLEAIPAGGANILLFDEGNQNGFKVRPNKDPFTVTWTTENDDKVTPAVRLNPSMQLAEGQTYTIEVDPPAGQTFKAGDVVKVTLIYVRPNYKDYVVDVRKIFKTDPRINSSLTGFSKRNREAPGTAPDTWEVTVQQNGLNAFIELECVNLSQTTRGYDFWLRVEIPGRGPHDFVQNASIIIK